MLAGFKCEHELLSFCFWSSWESMLLPILLLSLDSPAASSFMTRSVLLSFVSMTCDCCPSLFPSTCNYEFEIAWTPQVSTILAVNKMPFKQQLSLTTDGDLELLLALAAKGVVSFRTSHIFFRPPQRCSTATVPRMLANLEKAESAAQMTILSNRRS